MFLPPRLFQVFGIGQGKPGASQISRLGAKAVATACSLSIHSFRERTGAQVHSSRLPRAVARV